MTIHIYSKRQSFFKIWKTDNQNEVTNECNK